MKLLKNQMYCLNTILFNHKHFSKNFCEYISIENLNYKNEGIGRKYFKKVQNNQLLMVKNSILELEKRFMEFKIAELKDREEKIKREIELFYKPTIVSKDDMDKF